MDQAGARIPNLHKHAIKSGVIVGGVSIVLGILVYYASISFLASLKYYFFLMIIGFWLVIIAGNNYSNKAGGDLPYGKAFVHGFTALAVAGLLGTTFNFLLYLEIDPELPQKMAKAVVENREGVMRSLGTPQDGIDLTISGIKEEMNDKFSPIGLVLDYISELIRYAVTALITALFVRKNGPV